MTNRYVGVLTGLVLSLFLLPAVLHAQPVEEEPEFVDDLEGLDDGPVGVASESLDDLEGLDGLEGLDDLDGLGDGNESAGADVGFKLNGFRGFAETRLRSYVRNRGGSQDDESWIFRVEGELDFDLSPVVSGYFRPRFLIDVLDEENSRFEPFEAYISWDEKTWDLRVGQFVENWGIADTFNPVDLLNRRDLATDFLDPDRLGELGGRFRWLLEGGEVIGEPTFSFYALPVFRSVEFPTDESRWYFGQQPGVRFAEDLEETPDGLEGMAWAARFQSTLTTSPFNADLQFVAFRGPDRFPTFETRPGAGGQTDLVPVYFGATAVGGGLRAVPNIDGLSDYTIKAEMVYRWPYRVADPLPAMLPDDYASFVFGIDRLVPNLLTDIDQLTLTLEYVGESGADDLASDFRPFDSDIVLRGFWEANDFSRTSLETRAIFDVESAETILQVLYEQQLRFVQEDLKLIVDAQIFLLKDDKPSLFNFFPNNSNISVAIKWEF